MRNPHLLDLAAKLKRIAYELRHDPWVSKEVMAVEVDRLASTIAGMPDGASVLVPLTQRQAELLEFIRDFIAKEGYAPNFEEIADQFQYKSLATVHEHLTHLEMKGHIQRRRMCARGISIAPGVFHV